MMKRSESHFFNTTAAFVQQFLFFNSSSTISQQVKIKPNATSSISLKKGKENLNLFQIYQQNNSFRQEKIAIEKSIDYNGSVSSSFWILTWF